MGLFLNFELGMPSTTPPERLLHLLEQLRAFALGTPVARVSPMFAPEPEWQRDLPCGDPLEGFFRLWTETLSDPLPQHPDFGVLMDPSTASGFVIDLGEGSEPATVGFMRRRWPEKDIDDWHWTTYCKTQYASVVSDEHLITCHTALVALLDHAIALGIDVEVYDETEYWETRDAAVLLESVHKMNRLVAMLAGRVSDALGEGRVESPIFEHRNFEHLEMNQ